MEEPSPFVIEIDDEGLMSIHKRRRHRMVFCYPDGRLTLDEEQPTSE
jgi:hypothetical protein